MSEIMIGENKFVWDGKLLRVYDVRHPNEELFFTKDEVKELVEFNKFMAGIL